MDIPTVYSSSFVHIHSFLMLFGPSGPVVGQAKDDWSFASVTGAIAMTMGQSGPS